MAKITKKQLNHRIATAQERISLMTVLLQHLAADGTDSQKLATIKTFAEFWLASGQELEQQSRLQ